MTNFQYAQPVYHYSIILKAPNGSISIENLVAVDDGHAKEEASYECEGEVLLVHKAAFENFNTLNPQQAIAELIAYWMHEDISEDGRNQMQLTSIHHHDDSPVISIELTNGQKFKISIEGGGTDD